MQNDDKIDLSQLNKTSQTKKPSLFSKLPRLSFKKSDGIKRDNQGKFAPTSGSGGLGFSNKLDLKRMLPLVLVVSLVGGFMVFRSFAATGDVTVPTNGKLLLLDTTTKRFPTSPGVYIPQSYLANYDDESNRSVFGSLVGVGEGAVLPSISTANDKYYSWGDHMNNEQFAFTSDGQQVIRLIRDTSNVPYKVKIYSYKIDGREVKTLKESAEWYSAGQDGCFSGDGCINDLAPVYVIANRIIYETQSRPQQGSTERHRKVYTMKMDGTDNRLLDEQGGDTYIIAVDSYHSKIVTNRSTGLVRSNIDGTEKEAVERTSIPIGSGYFGRYNNGRTLPSPTSSTEVASVCANNAVTQWGMPAETECKDKGTTYDGYENLTHIVYDYKDGNKVLSVFTNNDLRAMGGIEFSSGGRLHMLDDSSFKWSPDGKYMTANFISYLYNQNTKSFSSPLPSVSIIINPIEKKLVKKISSDSLEIYAWQPIPAPDDKRDPTPTCTLEVTTSTTGYTATWTSKDVPAGWTTRLFNTATNTTIPNLPANGSQVVVPKVNTLNTYSLYFNDPANPASTNGCKAELDLNKAFPNQTDPPKDKRSPTQ